MTAIAGRLLVHLVGSIRRAVPGAADVLGERLDVATEPVDLGLAVQALESELERLLVEPLVVVIDDAEHLAGAAEAERVVADLRRDAAEATACGRRSRAGRWCCGRRGCSVAGRLTELGPADLAFGVEECAELMLRRTGREPSATTSWRRSGRRPRDGRSGSRSRPARSGRWRSGRRAPVRSTRTWRRSCWIRWSRVCATR